MTAKKIPVCKKCGQPHVTARGGQACASHSKGKLRPEIAGKPCRHAAAKGATVCRMHGAKAPQVAAAAVERIEAAAVAKLAATFVDPVEGEDKDPGEIVAEQIRMQYRLVHWFRARVLAIDPSAFMWGRTKEKIGGEDYGVTREAKPNAWLVAYLQAQRELEKLCLEAIRVGLELRRVRLEERDADVWVQVMDGVVVDLGHDPNAPETAAIVERHLRSIS